MINALTIDVEDYFHVTAFEKIVSRRDWDIYPLRVGDNTRRVLDLLDEHSLSATFFVLGWVAERDPALVREIARRGHEISCHGYGHELVYAIGPDAFREDVSHAKKLLEDLVGQPVLGYRAPSYSITADSMWALDILQELGFSYDSSIFPIRHDIYGVPGGERFPHRISRNGGSILEFPLSTLNLRAMGRTFTVPIAGGGYLRLLPAFVVRGGIRRINTQEKQPAVLYFHPWELDPEQPRIKAGLRSTFRHYLNLDGTEDKLRTLFSDLPFGTMRETLSCFAAPDVDIPPHCSADEKTVGAA
ncbi:polysaccharide deactylase family protein, PEP-CTERM locus subfamily [Desulfovibrio sp. X2]|uniref:XrtA system polysaccharide deacetylase n=1 Tax=Desulfovibrio sp. X2 TaxID=941449 RepID=UPI0003588D8D|nr:XrtA system polysaccharide deacetylase [Desulfovibrio sp. X2]EPR37243.1 polysaccharide deactylase family protein, PEP-CTERM locus subfamily [Desulfovibrio sp. X2]